jgi:small subunit ribosomal protein S8
MVRDSISNLIISLKNATLSEKEVVVVPFSKMSLSILELLKKEEYIADLEILEQTKTGMKKIKAVLKYDNDMPAIHDVKRISKFSKRIYRSVKDIKPVKQHYGIMVLTTPLGVVSNKTAIEKNVGGEVLFEIW